mmetsp:Transcript_5565/g.7683  ORF Transcript_5565/g.7683 Transcript_5565/m.7683 type:complete len:205 (+) Transcript_5565:2002-2616(+)
MQLLHVVEAQLPQSRPLLSIRLCRHEHAEGHDGADPAGHLLRALPQVAGLLLQDLHPRGAVASHQSLQPGHPAARELLHQRRGQLVVLLQAPEPHLPAQVQPHVEPFLEVLLTATALQEPPQLRHGVRHFEAGDVSGQTARHSPAPRGQVSLQLQGQLSGQHHGPAERRGGEELGGREQAEHALVRVGRPDRAQPAPQLAAVRH